MGGVGKTTAARSIARRYDLRLYSVDSFTYAHAERLPKDARSLDEIWVNSTPKGSLRGSTMRRVPASR